MSSFQDNAGAFATTRDQRVRELGRQGAHDAMTFLLEGHRHIAVDIMLETLATQARVAGIRLLQAAPPASSCSVCLYDHPAGECPIEVAREAFADLDAALAGEEPTR